MSSFAPPSKKARRSRSNGAAADSNAEFFPGCRSRDFSHAYKLKILFLLSSSQRLSQSIQGVSYLSESRTFSCFFVGISKIEYKPDGGPGDNLCFKHYNSQEVMI